MQLSKKDIDLFYKLFHSLLVYVSEKLHIIVGLNSRDDLRKFPLEEIKKLRDKLYEHPELIDAFVAENPYKFSPAELEIVESWHHFVRSAFYAFRYLKPYTVFLDSKADRAYGVLALNSAFQEMFPFLPIMVETALLPFKGRIIYDSLFVSYSITFGRNIRQSLTESYNKAKAQFGIIESLPLEEKRQSDAELLKFYLGSKQSREQYSEEIAKLVKDPGLLLVYHEEMGKANARTIGRQLSAAGIKNGWFAVLEGTIVASGSTREEAQKIADKIVPEGKRDFVYIFRVKK
jgi:hypothetical protein